MTLHPMKFSLNPWGKTKSSAPTPPSLSEQLADVMRGVTKRILLLEDDPNWRELVKVAAQDFDIEVLEATTSGEARRMIWQLGPVDTVVVDIGVVNGDGISFYRWLNVAYPKTHVVFLTGSRVEDVAEKVHNIGSAPIYLKPAVMSIAFLTDFIEKMGARKRMLA